MLLPNRALRPAHGERYEHPLILPAPPGGVTRLPGQPTGAFQQLPTSSAAPQATSNGPEKERRRRASKPKTKTGCRTCRIRHVKCDEAKPHCLKCTSTGRKCDGYDHPKEGEAGSSTAVTLPQRKDPIRGQLYLPASMSVLFQGTPEERRLFCRFQQATIPSVAGVSETQFWSKLVLRAGQQESIIRNAILALATLHEDYQLTGGTPEKFERASRVYGKAINELGTRLKNEPHQTAMVAIISSILFAAFEILRRNGMAAIAHYRLGMKALIQQMPLEGKAVAASSPSPLYPSSTPGASEPSSTSRAVQPFFREVPQDELDMILRVFSRYDIQACTFAKPKAERMHITLPDNPPTTLTLAEIKNYLDTLLVAVYQHIKSDLAMYRYWSIESVPPILILRRDQALITFEAWLDAIEDFFTSEAHALASLSPLETKALLGLRLQVRTAMIELRTCISAPAETNFDAFEGEFEDIVKKCEDLVDALHLPERQPLSNTDPLLHTGDIGSAAVNFTMELGINHPLFFVATKCRDWQIRRRAIACLKCGGREGVWEGPIMAIVAQRIVELEERGVDPGAEVPERNRFHAISKDVRYEQRRVALEARLARDGEGNGWTVWEFHREAIPF